MISCQDFPETVEEFMEEYKMVDTKEVYSNGTEFVPIFRMNQWFEHEKAKHGKWIPDKTGNSYWICTNCGFPSEASGAFALYHYCPNCGADMRTDG